MFGEEYNVTMTRIKSRRMRWIGNAHRQHGDLVFLLLFFQNNGNGLIK
jgi:hypothetical protein